MCWADVKHAGPAPCVEGTGRTGGVGHPLIPTIAVARRRISALGRGDGVEGAGGDDVSARAVGVGRALGARKAILAIETWVAHTI